MALRAAALLSVGWTVVAQLVAEPPVDRDALRAELAARAALLGSEPDVPTGIVSPTICDPAVKQHAGYLDVAPGAKYFFWMFESQRNPSQDPVVLWLAGGPGCSSQLALLAMNGPCSVGPDGQSTMPNKYSWTSQANVLWVDQPAATGFSMGSSATHDEDGVAQNMYQFLKNFYATLPQYKANDFYIFGESYAGHYVPAVAHYLWQQAKSGVLAVPLKGIGIGNGLTHPEEQYKWYPDMARDGGKSEGGTLQQGVITNFTVYNEMKQATDLCTEQIHNCNAGNTTACTTSYDFCNYNELRPYRASGYNPYDMRIKCQKPPRCYDFGNVEAFLNSQAIQQQLGVSKRWETCNVLVSWGFQADWMTNLHMKIPDLLADGVRALIYAGDADYICNWLGNKKWTLALEWPHQADFKAAEDKDYLVGDRVAGRLRASNGLHFLQVYQAGHMVPMDQPEVALAMLNDFLQGALDGSAKPAAVVV